MKKIMILVLISFLGLGAMAELPLNIGIHGGISSNRIKLSDLQNVSTQAHTGYMLGAFCRVNLGTIYLEPSLNYVQKKSVVEADNFDTKSTIRISSFDIPLMLGFQVLDLSVVKLRAFLGPVVSFPGKIKNMPSELPDVSTKNTVWNGKIGAGVDIWKLTFDIDYEKSFQKLGHELKAPRSFNFTLGFKII